jgi:hypothetical protein
MRKSIEAKRQRLLKSLPPLDQILRASLFKRRLRCGKPGCHCARGEGHPATYLGVTFPGGKTSQITLPKELVPVAREWIRNYQKLWKFIEGVSEINRELLRQRLVEPPRRRGTGRSSR